MTLENLAWALFGFALAAAAFAFFYDWSLRILTAKWLVTFDKIHANLWKNGYDQGVKDTKAALHAKDFEHYFGKEKPHA